MMRIRPRGIPRRASLPNAERGRPTAGGEAAASRAQITVVPRFALFLIGTLAILVAATGPGYAHAATVATEAPGAAPSCMAQDAQDSVNRAGLVVTFDDSDTRTFCIEFTEDSISGLELLQRSGLPLVTSSQGSLGGAVCKIDDVGCDNPGDCFCQCKGAPCNYWAYYRYEDSVWKISQVGASSRVIHDGDVDGWSWGAGGANGQPGAGGAGVCSPADPTPSPVPTSTRTPTPRATRTPTPTPTPQAEQPTSVAPSSTSTAAAPTVPAAATTTSVTGALAATHAPSATTTAVTTSTPSADRTPSATPRAGVIVSAEEGRENARNSSRRSDGKGGGSMMGIAGFGAVAALLAGSAGFLVYRRRRKHA